jgi:hypothetical protein
VPHSADFIPASFGDAETPAMTRPRHLILFVALVLAVLAGAPAALACGAGGYSYAGLSAQSHAFGIGATVTPVGAFEVKSGHVAGWVGVGGPGQGPGGTNEWLQVGFSGFPGLAGSNLYYELTLPSGQPTYHELATNLPLGKPMRIAVLEMRGRADWWRVWVNGAAVSQPIRLPGSHGRWSPIATAESWDGGTGGTCNGFLYRFHAVSIARAPGGAWRQLNDGSEISSSTTRIQRHRLNASFLAAEGDAAFRTLASFSP